MNNTTSIRSALLRAEIKSIGTIDAEIESKISSTEVNYLNGLPQFPNLRIKTVNGLCGSGKTYALIQTLKERQVRNEVGKVLIAVPTIKLCEQYKVQMEELGITKFKVIHSSKDKVKNKGRHISIEILDAINDALVEIVVICQASLTSVLTYNLDSRVEIFIDEVMQMDTHWEVNLPHNTSKLLELFEIDETYDNLDLYKLRLKNKEEAMRLSERNRRALDDMDKLILGQVNTLLLGNILSVTKKSWDKVVERNEVTDDAKVDMIHGNTLNKLYFTSILNPIYLSKFKEVTLMGANLESSLLHEGWRDYFDVKFEINEEITRKLRYKKHSNGHLVNITYLQERAISKHQLQKDGNELRDMHFISASNYFTSDKVLCIVNNSDVDEAPTEWEKCPVVSHGLNTYQEYTNVYFGAALNRTPMHTSMLMSFGFSSASIDRSTGHEIMYQGIMRSALRDPNNTLPISIVVADKNMALVAAELFDNSLVGEANGIKRKTIFTSKETSKKRKKMELLESIRTVNAWSPGNSEEEEKVPKSYNNRKKGTFCYSVVTNYYNSIRDNSALTTRQSIRDFLKENKELSKNNLITSKEENFLMNNTIFTGDYKRKKENALLATTLILDIDGGDMSHDICHKILSENKIGHFMYNSASASLGKDKYRVVIILTTAITQEVYTEMHRYIAKLFLNAGYYTAPLRNADKFIEDTLLKDATAKFTGIDQSKIGIDSLFYAPCIVAGYEEYNFFLHYGFRNEAEINRYALNPELVVLQTAYEPEPLEFNYEVEVSDVKVDNTLLEAKIDVAISSLVPGNRSYTVQVICGMLTSLPNDIVNKKLNLIRSKGAEAHHIRTGIKYINSNRSKIGIPIFG